MALVNGTNYDHIDLQAVAGGDVTRHKLQDTDGRALIAPNEASSTASAAHAAGSYFTYNNTLYRATVDIAQGGTITPGTNCAAAEMGAAVSELKSAFNGMYAYGSPITKTDMESGSWSYSTKVANSKRLRHKTMLPVTSGMTVKYSNPTLKVVFGILETTTSMSFLQYSGWINPGVVNGIYEIKNNGFMVFVVESESDITVDDYDCTVELGNITDKTLTQENKAADAKTVGDSVAITSAELYAQAGNEVTLTVESENYAQLSSGYKTAFNGYNVSGFNAIPENAKYITPGFASAPVNSNPAYPFFALEFYTEARQGYLVTNNPRVQAVEQGKKYAIPDGALFVRFTMLPGTNKITYQSSRIDKIESEIPDIEADVTQAKSALSTIQQNVSQLSDIADIIRRNNVMPYALRDDTLTEKVYYSGFKFKVAPEDVAPSGATAIPVSSEGISLVSGNDYTIMITASDPVRADGGLAFVLRDGANGNIVQDSVTGTNVTVTPRSGAVQFTSNVTSGRVYLSYYFGVYASYKPLSDFHVYLVPGKYETTDFDQRAGYEFNTLGYDETVVTANLTVGLPILKLYGSMRGMSKDDEVSFNYAFRTYSGTCSIKWQGSSSLSYSKKNFTIKFGNNVDAGWGDQKKYVLKANYIDNTSALNICGAKLWSAIVANRGTNPAIQAGAANNGAMDGFPAIVMLNNEFYGLYTFNTPKDKWTFGMGEGEAEYLVTAEAHSTATQFKGLTDLDGTDMELEYAPDGVSADTVKTSVNTMITAIMNATGAGWESAVDPYMDVNTAIDYFIFSALVSNIDGIDKNYILSTYDGEKWYLNAYDLDSIFGNDWMGGHYYSANTTSLSSIAQTSRLFYLIYTYSKSALISRYDALRGGILSEDYVYRMFYNFCGRIPQPVINEDDKKWPLKPGTATETLSRIMEWYRMHVKLLDEQIDALRT